MWLDCLWKIRRCTEELAHYSRTLRFDDASQYEGAALAGEGRGRGREGGPEIDSAVS